MLGRADHREPGAPRRRWVALLAAGVLCLAAGTASAEVRPAADRPGSAVLSDSAPGSAATPTTCFKKSMPDCTSADPAVYFSITSRGDTSACTFGLKVDWGDGEKTDVTFKGGADGTVLQPAPHTYKKPKPFLAPKKYAISYEVTVSVGDCYGGAGALSFTRTCAKESLSGAAWAKQFPASASLDALAPGFREKVKGFYAAMGDAGIERTVHTTYRPAERAYMMHYAWMVWKGQISAAKVPAFKPAKGQSQVGICWQHTDADGKFDAKASRAAADRLVGAFALKRTNKVAPALNTLHTPRLAVDMDMKWAARGVTIAEKDGDLVKITTSPRSSMNAKLIAVAKTYGVIHFINGSKDPNHWSSTGH